MRESGQERISSYIFLVDILPSISTKKIELSRKFAHQNIVQCLRLEDTESPFIVEDPKRLTFQKLSNILFATTGCHLALEKEIHGYHWTPSLIEVEVEVVPGRWDEVSVLVCPLRSLTPDWKALKEGSWKNGHMEELGKRELEEVKRILVRDWAAITGCPPSRKHQIQPVGTSIESTRQRTITSDLRGRKRRRCRQHGCVNVLLAGFGEKSKLAQLQDERQLSHDQSTTTNNVLEVPHIPFRGRRRRRARRVREPLCLGDSSSRTIQSHKKGSNICSSFITGWSLSSQEHDLKPPQAKQLMENGIQLELGLSSLPLFLQAHGKEPMLLGSGTRPHLTLLPRQTSNRTWSFHHQQPDHYLLLDRYQLLVDDQFDSHSSPKNTSDEPGKIPQTMSMDYDGHNLLETLATITPADTKPTSSTEAYMVRRSTVVLAQLTDYTGLVKQQSPPQWVYSHLQNVKILPPLFNVGTTGRMETYWQRLALLVMGSAGLRVLPYSDGYGFRHSNPTPVRKASRYGYFDVDTTTELPALPRWRAWLRFSDPQNAPECECGKFNTRHSVDSCSYLLRDTAPGELFFHPPFRIMHESFYLAHWPHEFFSHPKVIPWQRGPKESSFFEAIWDTRRNSSRHDVNIDYFPGNIPEATDTTKKIWINSTSNIQRDFHTEALFEQGIAHMIGGGVRQDIDRGLSLVLAAAEKGCSKAKATVMRLFRVYGKFLEKNDAEIRTWLLDGVRHGSEVALMDLRTKYPDSAECRQADQTLRTSFNLQWPGSLDYNRDVHPHFNLLDIAQLRKQMSHEKGKEALHTLFLSPSSCARSPNGKKRAYLYGTILHIASFLGLSDAVQFLIEAGLDINRKNSSRRLTTPLHCALWQGHYETSRQLIMKGANCCPDSYWETRFYNIPASPPPIFHLVNFQDERQSCALAELLVSHGAEVNTICPASWLDTSDLWPLSDCESVTPLRWAIMHSKTRLVMTLLELGARFPTSICWMANTESRHRGDTLSLHLETPCTNLDILKIFFKQLEPYKLPLEFSQTPLGLLVSEDDSPERRLRLGFGDEKIVIGALDALLDLQPGYNDQVLWSVVRHKHYELARYLLCEKGWKLETRWRGMTMLQTAILYGHAGMVSFLLSLGADSTLVTTNRKLTCFHLLAMVPRDAETDASIFQLLAHASQNSINWPETCDSLTSFHMAVRNKKLDLARSLLSLGADPLIPVSDQIDLLSQGRSGILSSSTVPFPKLANHVTILGEVLLQCNQDEFYALNYVESLVYLILKSGEDHDRQHLFVDSAQTMTVLHLLALLPFPDGHQIFSFAASILTDNDIDVVDSNGDTALHYACISHQANNVRNLLKLGANPMKENSFGLTPINLAILNTILGGPQIFGFQQYETPADQSSKESRRSKQTAGQSHFMNPSSRLSHIRRRRKTLQGDSPEGLQEIITLFGELGLKVNHPMKHLALGWGSLGEGAARRFGEEDVDELTQFRNLMPIEVVDGGEFLKLEVGLQRSESKAIVPKSGPVGRVLTEERFIMHQTRSAASMLSSHDFWKEWKEWTFVLDDEGVEMLASD